MKILAIGATAAVAALGLGTFAGYQAQTPPVTTVEVDVNANRHAISPDVYGSSYNKTGGKGINAPFDRMGGNNLTGYNPFVNADNKGGDWYFESYPGANVPFGAVDEFVRVAFSQGSDAMITVPIQGWVAKLGPNRSVRGSFSTTKYGAQKAADGIWGNGVKTSGYNVTGNDPNDAYTPSSVAFMRPYVQHMVSTFGTADKGGVKYYLLDNEPGIWYATHRDVQPVGLKMEELAAREIQYAAMIKDVDPTALVVGPEEWGWPSYIISSYDLQRGTRTDQQAHNGIEQMPFLLSQFKAAEEETGERLLDVFSLHFYPQGGEYSEDVSAAMQLRRNRSTRSLWDASYKDETWIANYVRLVPRMKQWVSENYPGTKTAITEYNWGAEKHINGATTQADILGIFGREGLDIGARWTKPFNDTVTYKAFQMYRNYDGNNGAFGDVSVSCVVPNPDNLSAFASQDSATGAVKVMVINKITTPANVSLNIAGFTPGSAASVFQLTATNKIEHPADASVSGGAVSLIVPAQSITLLVIPKGVAGDGSVVTPPPPSVPVAPSGLSAVSVSYDRIRLAWTDNSDNEATFEIQRSGDGVTFGALTTVTANVATFENKALTNNRTYFYRVRAVNTLGKSAYSNVAKATTAK